MKHFRSLVHEELESARKKQKKLNSLHEAYGVLIEEVAELFDEVRKKPSKRDNLLTLNELVQIAAVAQRAAEDLGYLGHEA